MDNWTRMRMHDMNILILKLQTLALNQLCPQLSCKHESLVAAGENNSCIAKATFNALHIYNAPIGQKNGERSGYY